MVPIFGIDWRLEQVLIPPSATKLGILITSICLAETKTS